MTSKSLFFKYMKEDLRHKLWLIALSLLGGFIALPISFLLYAHNMGRGMESIQVLNQTYVKYMLEFFTDLVTGLYGAITVIGACMVGFFCFRYLFHRNMVDTYHSMPITRKKLFFVTYLDGFIIWFVPFLLNMVITCILALCNDGGLLVKLGGVAAGLALLREIGISVIVLMIAFMLIYHLMIFAVMQSGNAINTLVVFGITGTSLFAIFSLVWMLFDMLPTFYTFSITHEAVVWISPIISSIHLLATRMNIAGGNQFILSLIINGIIVVVLGVVAYFMYCRRPSELSEQGVKNKAAVSFYKVTIGVITSIVGWIVFQLITSSGMRDSYSLPWAVFGAVLASVVCFGILDVVFQMDFKAFFAHKKTMVISTIGGIGICFLFYFGFFDYDYYIPKEENIASMGIDIYNIRNQNSNLEDMTYTDATAIWNLLQTGIDNAKEEYNEAINWQYGETMPVRVTLKNGRSYYRKYFFTSEDKEVLLPIVTSQAYIDNNLLITDSDFALLNGLSVSREGNSVDSSDMEKVRKICDAYNQDLKENPENVIMGEGILFARIRLTAENYTSGIRIDVYESMTNTVEALKECGYEEFVSKISVEDIKSITLDMGYDYAYEETGIPTNYEAWALEYFGMPGQQKGESNTITYSEGNQSIYQEMAEKQLDTAFYGEHPIQIVITDQKEIEELLSLICYTNRYRESILVESMVGNVFIEDKADRQVQYLYLKKGTLPMKYIQRFAELEKEKK